MKTKLFTLILFVLTITIACKTEKKQGIENTLENLEKKEHCFKYVLQNSYELDGEKIIENDFVIVNITIESDTVRGEYKVVSSKGEVNDSFFVGTIKNGIITGIQTYTQGNETLKEEMIFKIDINKIGILGGEKELKNGVNVFIDKSKGDYMMELPRVDCM